jgi:putative ABC transport system substrate-binding protein
MRRRVLVSLLVGVLLFPLAARAQSPMPVIGFLNTASPGPFAPLLAGYHAGLKDGGFVEGQNVLIEYRWAEGKYERLPEMAADLVRRKVTVLTATGGAVSARAARNSTTTIPVVFLGGTEPVGEGLVGSLNRPGGNVTGVTTYTSELAPKRLQLLQALMPKLSKIGILINPENPTGNDLQEIGKAPGIGKLQIVTFRAKAEAEFETVFEEAAKQRIEALLVSSDAFFTSRRTLLVALSARHAIPTGYSFREFVHAGGLMSYGTSLPAMYRQVGNYVARVLKGAKPAELPVQNPTTFVLTINLKTAKTLGLKVPRVILAGADEIVE